MNHWWKPGRFPQQGTDRDLFLQRAKSGCNTEETEEINQAYSGERKILQGEDLVAGIRAPTGGYCRKLYTPPCNRDTPCSGESQVKVQVVFVTDERKCKYSENVT
jgi:hypothetical protein